jgi:drug/metabolite transporter (DMT)-like permease
VLGILITLFSAFWFALSDVFVRRGVTAGSASQGTFVTVLIGVPLFAIAALITGQLLRLDDISAGSYGLLGLAGVVHYVLGRFFNYAAISAIGATRAAPVQAMALPYSVLIALLFLDEGVTLGMVFGIALILVGPLLMVERPAHRPVVVVPDAMPAPPPATVDSSGGFELRQTEGYLYALGAAVSYGSSPVLIRAAIEGEAGLSLLGGLVSYVAAALLLLASLALPQRRGLLQAMNPDTVRAFFGAGFAVFTAQMLRFIALSLASVAVVAALLRFGSVFTLLLSWIINRRLERITWRVVAGILISLLGALLLIATRA